MTYSTSPRVLFAERAPFGPQQMTILLITATFLCTIRVSRLGSLQSNSCSQLQLSQYLSFAATVLQNERGRRKGEQEIAALAEMINGKHFAFCLAIRAMQAELLQVLPKIYPLVYLLRIRKI